MIQIIGILGVFAAVIGGYTLAGGHLGVVLGALPSEMMIIGGSGIMTLLIAGDALLLKKVASSLGRAFKGSKRADQDYTDILCLLYLLVTEMRTKTPKDLERHIENPEQSAYFRLFPRILADKQLVTFICDPFRTITMQPIDSHRLSEMLETSIKKSHDESMKAPKALQTMADAFPALGIVAAVLGVIKAMGAISESPDVLGRMIGSALVGTFLGVFLSYGLVGPLASRIKSVVDEDRKIYEVARAVFSAIADKLTPAVCIEFGRQLIPGKSQPSFDDLDAQIKKATSSARSGASE